jgi:hypothetical protein
MLDDNSAAEREYQRQQEFKAGDHEYAQRFRENLDIVACDVYSDPSSNHVIDALNNDEGVREAWFNFTTVYHNDSNKSTAATARKLLAEIERYTKACPDVIAKAEHLSR